MTSEISIADSTKKTYYQSLKKLGDLHINNFDKTIEVLLKINNINTRKTAYSAIIWKLKTMNGDKKLIEDYSREVKNLRAKKEFYEEKNIPGKKEVVKDWSEIINDRDAKSKWIEESFLSLTDTKKLRHLKDFHLISLYTYVPPRRSIDYSRMKYVIDEVSDMDYNYYVSSKKIFIFNKYKTFSTYGIQRFHVPEELSKIIENYIDVRTKIKKNSIITPIKSGDLLLELTTDNQLTVELKGAFGYSVDTFRHSFITLLAKDTNLTLEKRREISESMAHGIMEQLKYQRVIVDSLTKSK